MKNKHRRAMSMILAVFTLVATFAVCGLATINVGAEYTFSGGGDGSGGNPYIVKTADDLANMKNSDKNFALGNDINLTGETWRAIDGFNGTFDGRGYKINNLQTQRLQGEDSNSQYGRGLFGTISKITSRGIVIKNLTINIKPNSLVDSGNHAAGLIGNMDVTDYGDVTIENVRVNGNVGAVGVAAGIVGYAKLRGNIIIKGCSYNGTISPSGVAGGLIGYADCSSMTIEKSSVSGAISGSSCVGGLIGECIKGNVSISDCCNTASVRTTSAIGDCAAGFAGFVDKSSKLSIARSYVACEIYGTNQHSMYSYGETPTIADSYRISTLADSQGTPLTAEQMRYIGSFVNWDFANVWGLRSWINNGFPVLRSFYGDWVEAVYTNDVYVTQFIESTYELHINVYPPTAANKKLNWTSDNANVATVSADGVVFAKGEGNAIITATSEEGGYSCETNIKVVKKIPVTGVDLNPKTLTLEAGRNQYYGALHATIIPADSNTSRKLRWSSSDPSVAEAWGADAYSAHIRTNDPGTAVIRVTTEDGGCVSECTVTVVAPKDTDSPPASEPPPLPISNMKMNLDNAEYTVAHWLGKLENVPSGVQFPQGFKDELIPFPDIVATIANVADSDIAKGARVEIVREDGGKQPKIDSVAVSGTGAQTITFKSPDLEAGYYSARLYLEEEANNSTVEIVHFRVTRYAINQQTFEVVGTPYYSSAVAPNSEMTVNVRMKNGAFNPSLLEAFGAGIVLAQKEQNHNAYIMEIKLSDANVKTGAISFAAPKEDGVYEIRAYTDVNYRSESTLASVTQFAVSAKAANLEDAAGNRRGGVYGSVTEFEATTAASGIRLEWPADDDAACYRVYRSEAEGDEGAPVAYMDIFDTKYIDVNVDANKTYWYTLRSVLKASNPDSDELEVLGEASEQISATTLDKILGGNVSDMVGVRKNAIMMGIDDPMMSVNGILQEIDPDRGTKPVIVANRTVVPIRAVVEAMLGDVGWDGYDRKITLEANGHTVTMWLGKKDLIVDGKLQPMDVAPVAMNDRTMVPVRFSAENLGCAVDWIHETQEVVIIYYS